MEEHAALQNGQVVFGPIPQLTQVLVIKGVERIFPDVKENEKIKCWMLISKPE